MKKLFLISMLLVSTVLLYSQNTVTLSLPQIDDAVPGTTVTVPITVDAITSVLTGVEIFIEYDPAVLTPVSWQNAHVNFPTAEWTVNLAYSGNECYFLWTDGLPFAGKEILAGEIFLDITFDYVAGYSALDFGMTKGAPDYPEKGETILLDNFFTPMTVTPLNGYVNASGPTTVDWNGSVSSDWDDFNNWDGGAVPTAADDVVIPAGTPNPAIIGGSAATLALTVDAGATLTIAAMADLTTDGLFTNDGIFYIESTTSGEAGSYIDMAGIGGGGSYQFLRDITNVTPLGSQVGWHLLSSPLPTGEFTSDDLYYYYMNYYDNATQMYVHHAGSPTIPCTPAPTMAIAEMEGWSIKYDDQYGTTCNGGTEDFIIDMVGSAFNTGAQTTGFGSDWNLLGNPYPSAIDVDAIAWPAGLTTNTVYMWDGWSSNNWVLGFTGNLENIPPTQGFFVEGAGVGTFDFTGAERIHDNGQWWWKNANDLLALEATVEGLSNSDVTYIRFNDVSTTGLDKEWDANKLFAGVLETPQIYTTSEGLELALNTQQAVPSVPMSFVCPTTGTYTIAAIETGSFVDVVLEDVLTGAQTDLMAGSYTFDYTTVEEVHPFIVHFTPLGTIENHANDINIYSNENNIYVNVPEQISGDIVVVNMMGQEVVRTDIGQGLNVLPMQDANTYYVVKVVSNDEIVTGKVYIK